MIKIYPSRGNEHKVIEVLDSMKGAMATLADCLDSSVLVEWGEGTAICYMEWWRTREGLDKHLGSPLFCRVLEAMEISRKPPVVNFYEMNGIGGLSLMENLRACTRQNNKKTATSKSTRRIRDRSL